MSESLLGRAYELLAAGDASGAARSALERFHATLNPIAGIEAADIFLVAGEPARALDVCSEVIDRIRWFEARAAFFSGLALWDTNRPVEGRERILAAIRLGYENDERLQMELAKRLTAVETQEFLSALAHAQRR